MWEPYKIKSNIEITEFYTAFTRKCAPEYDFSGESHDFWEFLYIIDGCVTVKADERTFNLHKNQIIFHKPNEFHTLKSANNTSPFFMIMAFNVSGKLINRFKNKLYTLPPENRAKLMEVLEFMKVSNNISPENITPTTYLKRLSDGTEYGKILKNLTEQFLISLLNIENVSKDKIENNETLIYSNAVSFIDRTIYDKIYIADISKACNVSATHLKNIFSKYSGLGVHEYILKQKILLAKQMLEAGASVTAISQKLSFSSQNYFSYTFKRETGLSPSEYKNML